VFRVCGAALALQVLVAVLASTLGAPAQADLQGDHFESLDWKIRLHAPSNWRVTERTGYPNVLLRLSRRDPDGKIFLSAEKVEKGTDVLRYAGRTTRVLAAIGFSVRAPQLHNATGAYWIDADNGHSYLRQAYLVAGGIAYALTLAAPDSRTRSQHLRAFDAALRSLQPLTDAQVLRLREEQRRKQEQRAPAPAREAPKDTAPPPTKEEEAPAQNPDQQPPETLPTRPLQRPNRWQHQEPPPPESR
jgi:hypothetical protein